MYNIPLAGSTVATSPLPTPDPGADMLAALNALANDISTNVGLRFITQVPVGGVSSTSSASAQVVASQNIPNLQALLSPRTTPSVAFGLTSIVTGSAIAGPQIRVRAGWTYSATTDPKTVSLAIGTVSFAFNATGTTTNVGMSGMAEMVLRKTGASSQAWWAWGTPSGTATTVAGIFMQSGSTSQPENGSCTVAVLCTSTLAGAGDVNVKYLDIDWAP